MEKVETLIVGGGQAGLAMSEQLSKRHLPHLVLERHRIAERWRSERWDGLHANGPAWHDRLPGACIPDVDPDGFATRDQMVDYFVAYAGRIAAPVRSQKRPQHPRRARKTASPTFLACGVMQATHPILRRIMTSANCP